MAIVDAQDLRRHADASGYHIPAVVVRSPDDAVGAVRAAEAADSPVALDVGDGSDTPMIEAAIPAIEAVAASAKVAVVLLGSAVRDAAAATHAIRLGCNVLVPAADSPDIEAIIGLARRCGVLVADSGDPVLVRMCVGPGGDTLAALAAAGMSTAALASCRRRRPVEHVVMFNAPELDEAGIAALFRAGREQLARVPGVRDVRTGTAITIGARYSLCWFIRLASEAVAASYKTDPIHLDFADRHFRPAAPDRLTIDFVVS